ncbi:DUF1501 domain-containing protein [Flexithrix dorotheae]|uniref:DUF1501 domain-containing protein n=1 Tax=Flexithrix dorotheae TaxID=70993 RepID=UPI00037341AA|nr:DUF1501 domain-containing protein [Flexithrix dorotheae]
MNIFDQFISDTAKYQTRRHFLKSLSTGVGAMALGSMVGCGTNNSPGITSKFNLGSQKPHFAPKAKRVIFLHMEGAPSQLELFDFKPELAKLHGKPCPPSLLEGKRFAFITGTPKIQGPYLDFKQRGQSGAMVSDALPYFSQVVDEVTFLKAVHTDEFNHAPAQLFMYTGGPRLGRPSMGSWVVYGLGSENENLPGFIVLASGQDNPSAGKNVWGSGFLPTVYQGVNCQSAGEPILYLSNPKGVDSRIRRRVLNSIKNLNEKQYNELGDPETLARINQYEMAFKMQMEAPEAMDITEEPDYIHQLYGTSPGVNSFANNCLLARRLVERGVRFIQLFHTGWDSHGTTEYESINHGFLERCKEVDQAMSGLILDLKQRGLLEDTLVVWGGEFGRTPMMENRGGKDNPFVGRDHHPYAYTMWMAGGGVKSGLTYGETDEIGYYGIKDQVHIHDLQATILNQLGMDHEKLTYQFQGRDFRLTDVHGKVVKDILV